ncbi:MAG TPA: hypothetical protein VFZ68_15580 [Acidimicrobiales bacterium]
MEPATLATVAVAALVRYVAGKAAGVVRRAGRDIDAVVDDRLDRLYERVRERFSDDRRAESTLLDLEEDPTDARRQGRLELALEGVIEEDPEFASRLAAMLEDLSRRPPPGGVAIRDAGPVAGGDVVIRAGRDAAGRDLTSTDRDER